MSLNTRSPSLLCSLKRAKFRAFLGLLFACTSAQALSLYTYKADFRSALGGVTLLTEDFNSIVTDISFKEGPVDLGDFTIEQTGSNQDFRNILDADQFQISASVNGTSDVSGYVDSNPATGIKVTYDAPINAWGGADLSTLEAAGLTVTVGGESANILYNSSFFGLIADTAFTMINFSSTGLTSQGGEGFEMDNFIAAIVVAKKIEATLSHPEQGGSQRSGADGSEGSP